MPKTIARNSLKEQEITTKQEISENSLTPKETKEMSFLEHLEELRWHLIRSAIAVGVATIIAFAFPRLIFHHIILGPSRADFITYRFFCNLSKYFRSEALCIEKINFIIQSRTPGGQLFMHLSSSLVVGLIIAFPYVFWQIWSFVKPGLYKNEQRITQRATFYVSTLFLLGVMFGYFLLAPLSINFLANYQVDVSITNQFDITAYVSTITTLVLGCGLVFQLPIIVYFLTRAEIITSKQMKKYRRHAIVGILIVAAIITPPDVFTQILVAIPLTLLYEVSIFISQSIEKKQ
ncbi:MAG: twin-arginine translocase subunit TatC [Microscillaceae bacterium]|nr:twin-arginine translocase subunit TatC [Microscillaceae bacterium]MDW8461417.1 twin-arginine translocase subunit TatC [Cytophagales bacterium]